MRQKPKLAILMSRFDRLRLDKKTKRNDDISKISTEGHKGKTFVMMLIIPIAPGGQVQFAPDSVPSRIGNDVLHPLKHPIQRPGRSVP